MVGPTDAEQARAAFLDLAPEGFEEIDVPDGVELVAYLGDPSELLTVFPGAALTEVEEGWELRWKAFHRPVEVAGLWLGPPWETAPHGNAIVIDPGQAFGTGAHPTTRLCVELLARCGRGALLDVGCGSGVLAIAGSRLGFGPIVAVDDDPVAVEAARANVRANGVAVEVDVLDALVARLPPADVAVANVLLGPVEAILARVDAREAVTSGYLAGERPAHDGWTHVETLELDGWAADRFTRSSV